MRKKRWIAGLLATVMLVGLLPTVSLAAAVDLTDAKWSNLALDMIKNENNTAVTFNPTGGGNWGSELSYMTDGDYDTANAYTTSEVPTDFKENFDENFYVQFDLGENRTVGGFEFSVSAEDANHGFKYTIYGKASTDANWTKLTEDTDISHVSGQNIKQHPLSEETTLRYVRVVLHTGHGGAVGAFSEFKIFGATPLDLTDDKWSNLALDMIKNENNTAVTFNPTGGGNWGSQLSYMTDGDYDTANAYTTGVAPLDLAALDNIASGLGSATTVTTSTVSSPEGYTTEGHPDYLTDGKDTQFKWVGEGIRNYISKYGNPWVNFSFGENRSIGGVRITFEHKDPDGDSVTYKYNVLGKAVGDSEYTTLFSNCTGTKLTSGYIQTHAFSAMKELSDIKIEFTNESTNAWLVMTQLEIFGTPKTTPPGPGPDEPNPVDPDKGLIEVAGESEITVPSKESDAGKLIDGNLSSLWVASGANWPANVDFALPGNLLIKRVEIDFEKNADRSVGIKLSRAVNNVTSDYQALYNAPTTANLAQTFVYSMDEAQRMTHLRITLSDPNPSTLWPAMAEVRIYAVDETVRLADFPNITDKATRTSGANYVEYDFHGNQQLAGFTATLPAGVTAKVLGKKKQDANWTTYLTELQNGDNAFRFLQGMSVVRVELSNLSQLTNFQIFGNYTEPKTDLESVAFDKPTHGNFANSYLVNDGDKATAWTPDMYPAYVDIDLEATYAIDAIEVYTPTAGYSEYTVYTSLNGRDFDKVGEKLDQTASTADGKSFSLGGKEAKTVRVYLEYYSESDKPALNEVRVLGSRVGDAQPTPSVDVGTFNGSDYAAPITPADTIAEVQGIISRQVGAPYVDWFTFALADRTNGYDYFTLSDDNGKIKVTGNNGVSLATGVNHYLKYYCNVNISQVGNQTSMPAQIVPINGTVTKETKYPVRYAYNYCTHSYSMSFWNEAEWRNELDWLALNGVNVVLDITGQEAVWYEFLTSLGSDIGYTPQEAKDFLAGPGYYAWAYMANLTGFGGPIHDSFLTERAELGRKNQRIMRTLGMEPVLQAFSGMVPVEIATHDPDAAIIPQGVWCSFQRPTMLKTDTATYDQYAAKFYAAQKKVFGDAKYYATDPFHEGGTTGGMSTTVVASALLDSLLEFDSDAVWVIQSWQGNPSTGLLAGLRSGSNPTRTDRRNHAIVLDLYAEKDQNWKTYGEDTDGDGLKEFSDTPWVFCQLNNFGGRMGLHGHLDALQKNIPDAANKTRHMAGIGISPEGSQENPVLYDFLFETIWTDNADQPLEEIDLDQWLKDYVRRRYGAQSDKAEQAMAILAETVYKDSLNRAGQGAPESVVNARPALSIGAASTWGNASIAYDKVELEKAAKLLLEDYDTLSASDAYLYDLADVLKQVLSNCAQNLHSKMAAAYNAGSATDFTARSNEFLALIDMIDRVLATRSEFTFGKWTGGAELMAKNADDFTKRLYLRNSKALVTTWGSIQQCEAGGLKDYSNRQWAGLTKDFYKVRWEKWIAQAKTNLSNGNHNAISITWFPWEWAYARDPKHYDSTPSGESLKTLGNQVLNTYGAGPAAYDTRDVDHSKATATAGSEETSQGSDAAANVLDNSNSTIWHTDWNGTDRANMWITLDLGSFKTVNGLRCQPRQNQNNGIITGYEIYVSKDGVDWGTPVATGTWELSFDWKMATFTPVIARYVKLVATASQGNYASAATLRVTGSDTVPVTGITLSAETATLYTNPKSGQTDTITLIATVEPAEATNKTVIWDSWNTEVATVNNGVVTAVGVDETRSMAHITATTEDGSSEAICDVSVRINMGGTVNITGTPKYGETLTASTNQITPRLPRQTFTYQWYRGDAAIDGATGSEYPVDVDDINEEITVTVIGNDPCVGELTSPAVTPAKADGPDAPVLTFTPVDGPTKGTVTITEPETGETYEYKKTTDPDSAWTDVTNNAVGELDAGSYQVRIKENSLHFAGDIATVTVTDVTKTYYTVSYTVTPAGGATVTLDNTSVEENDSASATVRANPGYVIKSVAVGETTLTGVEGVYTVEHVTGNTEFKVTLEKLQVTITHALTNITCSLEGDHGHTVAYGEPFSITLTADEGYDLPDTVTITNKDGVEFFGYKYEGNTITFSQGITEDLTITGAAKGKTYTVIYTLSHLTADGAPAKVDHGAALNVTLAVDEGYELPETVTVTVNDVDFTDFTYDPTDGTISIAEDKITGNVVIAATAVVPVPDIPDVPVATYTVTFNSQGGSAVAAQTVNGGDKAARPADPTRSGYTFGGWYTDAICSEGKEYDFDAAVTRNMILYAKWTAVSSTGSGSSRPTTTTTTSKNEDGSTTTTVTNNRTGAVTETTKKEDGTVEVKETLKDGTVTETVKNPDGSTEVVETKTDGTVTETVTNADGSFEAKETKPDGTVTETVKTSDGSTAEVLRKDETVTAQVTVSQEAVEKAEGGAVTLPVAGLTVEDKPTVSVTLPKGTEKTVVSVPIEQLTPGTVAVRVKEDGTEEIIPQSMVENGMLTLPAEETGTIRIQDNSKSFQDVKDGDWFADSVTHVTSRELFLGTGDNNFSPDVAMTRGMLVTVLFRYAGTPEGGQADFNDVEDDAYYTDAVRWATENQVVTGVGNGLFAPDQVLSREQLAVMLYRYMGSPSVDGADLEDFSDGDSISAWARQALAWAVSQGIIQGKDGHRLAPQDNASRAEVSTMLYRFTKVELLRK